MSPFTLVLLARSVHVVSGVIWAGFVMIAGLALVTRPRDIPAEQARLIRRISINRAARFVGPAAILNLLSGIYLFATLHRGQQSIPEIVLGLGALSAIASFFVGALGSGPVERQLSKLEALDPLTADATARMVSLDRRIVIIGRVTATLLLFSTVAMAI